MIGEPEAEARQPLLMLNGYAATGADWDPTFLELLGGFARPFTPDNRGVGQTPLDSESGELTIELMAADALRLLDQHGIERLPVLGWSMGGFIAQTLAATAPARVSRLVLLSTDHGGPRALRAEARVWEQLTDHGGSPREQASRLISLLFPPRAARAIDAQFGEIVAAARARLDPVALSAQEAAMERWYREPPEARLEAISAPVLCAAGAEDVVIPAANTALLSAALPDAWRATFAGAGHAFMARDPDRVAELIRVFLDR